MNKKAIGILACVIVIVCAAVFGGIYVTRNIGKSEKVISEESAEKRLAKMVDKINPETGTPVKSPIEYDSAEDEADELPDIDTCKVMVEAETSLYAERRAAERTAGFARWQRNSTNTATRWAGRRFPSRSATSTAGRRWITSPQGKPFRKVSPLPACSG